MQKLKILWYNRNREFGKGRFLMKKKSESKSIFDLSWQEKYTELKRYHELFGNPHVPINSKKYKSLAIWVANQRSQYKKGRLSQERIEKLNELGFMWAFRGEVPKTRNCSWADYIESLVRFKKAYGHDLIPVTYRDGEIPLGNWVANMRRMRNRGDLADVKIQALNAVDFAWDSQERAWELRYNELKDWYNLHNDSSVPINVKGKEYQYCHNYLKPSLGEWATKQRLLKRKNQLPQQKIDLLNELEFDWTGLNHYKNQHRWFAFYKRLKEKEDVNFAVYDKNDKDYDLYEWCMTQRLRYQKGQLQQNRFELLESLGFKFHIKEIGYNQSWINKYNQYKQFIEEEGFENRKKLRKENQSLANWANFQRRKYKNNQLEEAKIQLLNEIGFRWEKEKKAIGSQEDS